MVDMITQNAPYYVRAKHFDTQRMAGTVSVWKNNGGEDNTVSTSSLSSSLAGGDQGGQSVKAPSASFSEFLDVVNPLHHLPVVGNVYRSMTGDEISSVARIAGGTIYGGPLGGLSSIAQAAIEEHSGDSMINSIQKATTADKSDYAVFDDERTAGLRRNDIKDDGAHNDSKASASAPSKPLEISQAETTNPISLDAIQWEKREPVTTVTIDLAMAKVKAEKPGNQWNLNS